LAISFMNEMRVASIPFAAYFVISADAMSISRIGLPVARASASASSPQGRQCTGLFLCCNR